MRRAAVGLALLVSGCSEAAQGPILTPISAPPSTTTTSTSTTTTTLLPATTHTHAPRVSRQVTSSNSRLACIRAAEQSAHYGVVSKSGKHRGAYQFDQETWESNGGTGDPAAASPAEQDRVAENLLAARGTQPWPPARHC